MYVKNKLICMVFRKQRRSLLKDRIKKKEYKKISQGKDDINF